MGVRGYWISESEDRGLDTGLAQSWISTNRWPLVDDDEFGFGWDSMALCCDQPFASIAFGQVGP